MLSVQRLLAVLDSVVPGSGKAAKDDSKAPPRRSPAATVLQT